MSSTAFRVWVPAPDMSGSTWWMSGCGIASTPGITARICRTCATGPGPTKRIHKSRVRILVLNVGSSSLKGSIVETADLTALAKAEVSLGADATKRKGIERTVRSLLAKLDHAGVEAVGHRVVHGGTKFRSAVRVDDRVLKGIEALAEFAPLHNPVAVTTIRATSAALPGVPQVAAFDT